MFRGKNHIDPDYFKLYDLKILNSVGSYFPIQKKGI